MVSAPVTIKKLIINIMLSCQSDLNGQGINMTGQVNG